MELKLFTLCEGAFNHNGHLTIVNTIDFINGEEFPYRIPQFGIAAKLNFNTQESGNHHIYLICVDALGKQSTYIDSPISIEKTDVSTIFCISVNMGGMLFASPGVYEYILLVDEKEMGRIELKLNLKQPKDGNK